MIMKISTVNKLVLATFSFTLIACNDAFLERAPLDRLNDGHFWQTENDLRVYCNNFYNDEQLLPSYTGYATPPFQIEGNSGSDCYVYMNYNTRMNGESTLPASGGGWTYSDWNDLRNINYFIDHYDNADCDADIKEQYLGEALFFRSIFYYNMLKRFGDLPWVSHALDPNDDAVLMGPRLPRNQVVDSMMVDLDRAVAGLPARGNGAWTGRVTKEVAMALQARIALYEGTWEKHHARKGTKFKVDGQDGTKFLEKAAAVSGDLIKMSEETGYPALDNMGQENAYRNLFIQKDYSNSKEVLLWRKYSVEDNEYTYWLMYTVDGGGFGLTKNMIDSYLCIDGHPISGNPNYKGDATLQDVVSNRDPRLRQTIVVDDGEHLMWDSSPAEYFTTPVFEGPNENRCVTGYQLYKGHSADYAENQTMQCTTGAIYFRYAEVLLIYAEAKAELGTISQGDVDKTINLLRRRVGMTNGLLDIGNITEDPEWEFKGISPILQEVRRERKVELANENFRIDDIFRWAAADELIKNYRPLGAKRAQWENYPGATDDFKNAVKSLPVNEDGYIDPYQSYPVMANGYDFNLDRDYLYPIPQDQRLLNPALKQNPGW